MPSDRKIYTLLKVAQSIQKGIADRYPTTYWIRAEINKLNFYPLSGHAYPELVEKVNGRIEAEMRSVIWKTDFDRIQNKFLAEIKEPLKDGIKVLIEAKITFSPTYGLTLTIQDIDPLVTLGDLEREKLESIQNLKKLGIYDRNKQVPIAVIPQRIAVISVETSKGWSDFLDVLRTNKEGYDFSIQLFPAILQGDKAPGEIMEQLNKVATTAKDFDAVAIIRGGGGEIGLSCYNHFELCKTIAEFPLPILTGIGHSTNETVSEMVSHTNAITPTKLAEFLLQRFRNFEQPMESMLQRFQHLSQQKIKENKHLLVSIHGLFGKNTQLLLQSKAYALMEIQQSIQTKAMGRIQSQEFRLEQELNRLENLCVLTLQKSIQAVELLAEKSNLLSPVHVLKRGFSITRLNGKSITDSSILNFGDEIETEVLNGLFISKIEKKKS
jgi:exodeoxyribonuclease VII large subunit